MPSICPLQMRVPNPRAQSRPASKARQICLQPSHAVLMLTLHYDNKKEVCIILACVQCGADAEPGCARTRARRCVYHATSNPEEEALNGSGEAASPGAVELETGKSSAIPQCCGTDSEKRLQLF